ncbi:hypothetical protein ACWDA8_41050, partial [Streptomyces sp. NPDC001130]
VGCLQVTYIPGLGKGGAERALIEAVRIRADRRRCRSPCRGRTAAALRPWPGTTGTARAAAHRVARRRLGCRCGFGSPGDGTSGKRPVRTRGN